MAPIVAQRLRLWRDCIAQPKSATIGSINPIYGILVQGLESQLKRWKTVILISFGTVSPSSKMPENWKKNLVTVIESFPEVLFLWKYEVEDSFSARKLPNIIMSPFFPQNDLLRKEPTNHN